MMDDRTIMREALQRIAANDGYAPGIAANALAAAKDAQPAPDVAAPSCHDPRRLATIVEIKFAVAAHFGVSISDLESDQRRRAIARPRQIAMYLAHHLTVRSYPEIGRAFGGRDHSTVIWGERAIAELIRRDPDMALDVDTLSAKFLPRFRVHD